MTQKSAKKFDFICQDFETTISEVSAAHDMLCKRVC